MNMWPHFDQFSTHSNALSMSNLQLICRLCMVNCGAAMEPIFRSQASVTKCIADKVASVTRLTLRQGDGLPALVCQQCIFQLDVADTFIQRCMLSDQSLRSILLQQQPNHCTVEKTRDPLIGHAIQPLPSRGILIENQECAEGPEILPDNAIQTNLQFSNCAPSFEAVNLALPDHLILDDGSMEEGAEPNNDVPTLILAGINQGKLSSDPLLDIKCETFIETASCEETEGITHPINPEDSVKVEASQYGLRFEHSSDGAFNEDSGKEDSSSMKTEDLAGHLDDCDMHDYNFACIQNAPNSNINTPGEVAPQSNQNQLSLARTKPSCPICLITLANMRSLTRHIKIHKRNDRLQQRRLAYGTKSNSLSIPYSKIICPMQALSKSNDKSLDTRQSSYMTCSSITGGNADSTAEAPANDARVISITSKVPHKSQLSLETTRKHKCMLCSSTFANRSNLVRHRKLHYKKILMACVKEMFSKSKQSVANQKLNQLNMIPIVKVTQLVITKDGIQMPNSLKQFTCKQPLIFPVKQSPALQIEHCERRISTQGNETSIVQNSAGSPLSKSSFGDLSQKASLIEKEWDYNKNVPFISKENTKKCSVCSKVCRDNSQLKSHMRSHTGERPFRCMVCNKRYREEYSLKRHVRDHTENKELKCRKCTLSFNTVVQLRVHEMQGCLKCLDCGKKFLKKCSLRAHSITHTDARPWECDQCHSEFKRAHDLFKHQRCTCKFKTSTVGSSTKSINKSQICKNKPSKLQGPAKKLQTLVGNNLLLQNSRRTQTQKKGLVYNPGLSPHKCEICGKAFKERRNLNRHSVVHTKERPWNCEICGLGYKNQYNLKKHEQRHNLKKKLSEFDSSTKPKLATNSEVLVTNTSAFHKGLPVLREATGHPRDLRPNQCTTCGKTFKTPTTLKLHFLTHSEERPWTCGQCNFAFKRKDSLLRHIKLRNHKTTVSEIPLQNELSSSRIAEICSDLNQNDFSQTFFPKNPEHITSIIHEPNVSELLTRSGILANDCNAEISQEMDKPSQNKPANSDGIRTIAVFPTVTGCSQGIELGILAKNARPKHPEIFIKMYESSHTELSSPHEDISNEVLEPIYVKSSIQMRGEIVTNDYHIEQPKTHKEMDESSITKCLPHQEATAHAVEINSEPLKPINAEFYPDVKLKMSSERNLEEEILLEEIHEDSQNELTSRQDSGDSAEVINTVSQDPIFAESLGNLARSDSLTQNHAINNKINASSQKGSLPLQEEAAAEMLEKIYFGSQEPIVTECSNEIINYDDKQQLRLESGPHLKENEFMSEIGTHANVLYSPSIPHLTTGANEDLSIYTSRIVLVAKNAPNQRRRPFHCMHCDKTYSYLQELTNHTSCNLKEHSFNCNICTASFNQKCQMRDHLNSHTTIKWHKCETCAMEFKSNSDLIVHTLAHSVQTVGDLMSKSQNSSCKDSKEITLPALFYKGSTTQRSTSEDVETSCSEVPSRLQSSILFEALSRSIELQNVDNSESLEMPNNHSSKNIVPPFLEQLPGSFLQPRMNDQLNQDGVKKPENTVVASMESQITCMYPAVEKLIHENLATSLNLQHSAINRNCYITLIYPQQQVSNNTIEDCKAEVPMRMAQSEGMKSQSTEKKPNSSSLLKKNYNKYVHIQPKVAPEDDVEHNTNSFSKLLGPQKKDVFSPLHFNKKTKVNSSTKNASLLTASSGIAPSKIPYLDFFLLGKEFYNQRRSVECKPTSVKKRAKGNLTMYMKSHKHNQKRYECEGCNRSFNVTGSLGCNCLAS